MKKAYNMFDLPSDTSYAEVFRAAASAGFAGVEINLTQDLDDGEIADLRALAVDCGVDLIGFTDVRFWTYHLSDADESNRKEAIRILKAAVTASGKLGLQTLLVVPGVHDGKTPLVTLLDNARASIKEVLPLCAEYGVTVCVENVWNDLLISPFDMRDFIDSFASPYVAAYFDAGNILRTGYVRDWIDTLGPRIRCVHIKDFQKSVGNLSGFCPLGEGDMDWISLREGLDAIGYSGYVTTEVGDRPAEISEKITLISKKVNQFLNI